MHALSRTRRDCRDHAEGEKAPIYFHSDAKHPTHGGDPTLVANASELLDIDGAIAAHCLRTGEEGLSDIEERLWLHLAILAKALADSEGSRS